MDGQPAWKRWLRKWRGVLLLAAGLAATYAFSEWRQRAHEADIREAKAAGFQWAEGGSPYDAIRKNWRATFRKETWTGSYRHLDLGEVPDLTPYRSLIHRLRPTRLWVHGSNNVDGLKGLTSLELLDLSDCPALQNVDALKGLTALQGLDLSDCDGLQNVDGLKGLTSLEALDLTGSTGIPAAALREFAAALPNTGIILPDGNAAPPP